MNILFLTILTILQNASFTLTSRAKNSKSLWYNAIASVLSNGIWLLVVKLVIKADDLVSGIAYVSGATIGSVAMQYVAVNFIEKKKVKKEEEAVNETSDL